MAPAVLRAASKRSSKRSVPEMRRETKELGGVFLDWSKRLEEAPGNACHRNAWDTLSAKGFRVFATGCILPHPYYSRKGSDGPARVRGPRASLDMFHPPRSREQVADGRNELGWPTQAEVSHLCHWGACVNPDHLRWEPRWQNWRRIYCGGCDCNADRAVPCLLPFHPSSWWEDESNWPGQLTYESTNVKWKEVLPQGVALLDQRHFDKEDLHMGNRNQRRRRRKREVARVARRKAKRQRTLQQQQQESETNNKKLKRDQA